MKETFKILMALIITCSCDSCIQNKAEDTGVIKEDLTIEKYTFIVDTSEIGNLVYDEVRPDGHDYEPKDFINRFIKLSVTNNTNDTIFFSKPYSKKTNPIKSLTLCYSPITGYSNDSIYWHRPNKVTDYLCPFSEVVLSKETTTRYLFVDSINKYKFFEFSVYYELNKELREKTVVLKFNK